MATTRRFTTSLNAPLSRRQVLALGGGLGALGALAACGSNTGREGAAPAPSGSGSAGGGTKPTLNQWYHQYGEAGTQQAVQKYAKDYPTRPSR